MTKTPAPDAAVTVEDLAIRLFERSSQGGRWANVGDTDDGKRGDDDWQSRGYWRDLASVAFDRLTALAPAGGDYVLVPREPTEAMRRAGQEAADDHRWRYWGYGKRKPGEGLDGMEFHVCEGYRAMLSAAPAISEASTHTETEARVAQEAQFLCDRLDDLEWMDDGYADVQREYFGHVEPSHSRLKAMLAAAPPPPTSEPGADVDGLVAGGDVDVRAHLRSIAADLRAFAERATADQIQMPRTSALLLADNIDQALDLSMHQAAALSTSTAAGEDG